jgi:hypothetical protein
MRIQDPQINKIKLEMSKGSTPTATLNYSSERFGLQCEASLISPTKTVIVSELQSPPQKMLPSGNSNEGTC